MDNNNNSKLELLILRRYVRRRESEKIKKIISNSHAFDVAQEVVKWELDEKTKLIEILGPEDSSEIILHLPVDDKEDILGRISDKEINQIASELESDDIAHIIDDMDDKTSKKFMENIDQETKKEINQILKYTDKEAGYHMSFNFVSLRETITIKTAKNEIREQIKKEDAELAGNILLISKEDKLVGSISIEEIFSQPENRRLSSFRKQIVSVVPKSSLKEVRDLIADYNLDSVPVVNNQGKLLGIIEPEDMIEVLTEVEEEHLNFVKSSTSRTKIGKKIKEYKPYTELNSFDIVKTRVFWIILLLFLGLITQVVITGFQHIWGTVGYPISSSGFVNVLSIAFASALSIASSINDSAGNSGSQTTSVLIEAIALGEVKREDHWKSLRKETLAGSHTGMIVAVASFIRTYFVWLIFGDLFPGNSNLNGLSMKEYQFWLFIIASTAAISFYFSIVFGNFIAAIIPLIGTRREWKSTVISGPIVTTLVDIFVFTLYLGLTTAIFVPLANSGLLAPISQITI